MTRAGRSRVGRSQTSGRRTSFKLSEADAAAQQDRFGVAREQIEHDFVISHMLTAISQHADRVIFYGGTALSRTVLDGLRLSEDIDLLTVGPRKAIAPLLDETIRRHSSAASDWLGATPGSPRPGALDARPCPPDRPPPPNGKTLSTSSAIPRPLRTRRALPPIHR